MNINMQPELETRLRARSALNRSQRTSSKNLALDNHPSLGAPPLLIQEGSY